MFKKKSPAVSAAPAAASTGNVAVKKHIKKQHIAHNAGMQAPPSMTGAAPASSVPVMPNPYSDPYGKN